MSYIDHRLDIFTSIKLYKFFSSKTEECGKIQPSYSILICLYKLHTPSPKRFYGYYENNFVILVHGLDAIRCRLLWVFTVQTLPPHPTQPVKTRLLIIQTDISGLHGISFSFTYSWKRCIFWGRLEPQDWVKSGWISYVYRNMITSTLYRLNE